MKAPIRLFNLFVLFLGINQSWGQRLEARREWVNHGTYSGTQNFTQSVENLVFDNDTLFAFLYGPPSVFWKPAWGTYTGSGIDTVLFDQNSNGDQYTKDAFSYQVYST